LKVFGKEDVGKVFIFSAKPEEREFLFRLAHKLGSVYTSPSLDKAVTLINSTPFDVVLVDAEMAADPALKPHLLSQPCLILTGRVEDKLKESIRQWPAGRIVDYLLISPKPDDLMRSERVLGTAQEYARLKEEVVSLASSKDSAEAKLKRISQEIKGLGSSLSANLVREYEKRIEVENRYLRFQKLKQKFEDTLHKLHAANDVSNLLDILADIKDHVQAESISLYIREENETLGKFLKPLVWDDAVPSHADFSRHVALWQAQDFASFAARTGQELSVVAPIGDPRFSTRYRNHMKSPLRSILASPLKHADEVIGLIEVYNKTEHGRPVAAGFPAEDRQVLRGLSEHMSLAISKLNLIQYDALTGLLRPDPFFEKVIQKVEIQRKRRVEAGSCAMVMGDVDWFKNYNDRNGQEAGNRLLRELAGVLKASIREEDLLCRYGGEEFLFFLTGVTNIEEATLLTERIRKAVEDHYFEFEEFQPRQNLTMSYGVTFFECGIEDSLGPVTKAMLKKVANEADIALAEAKGKRISALKAEAQITKNRVCTFVRDRAAVMTKTALLEGLDRKSFIEKRRHERFLTSTLCIYRDNGSHRVAQTVDLSLGGTKISSKTQFRESHVLDLFLVLGTRANPLKGEVVYSRKVSPHSEYYYTGLKFRDLSAEDRQAFQSYFGTLGKRETAAL
jgi:diguanylate cyclase (GGDEF)-like protein